MQTEKRITILKFMEVKNELSEIWEDLFQELFDYVEQHEEDFDNPYNGGSKE